MNIKHLGRGELRLIFPGMNAVHRADVHARGILGPDAWLANDIRHWTNDTSVVRSGACPAHPRLGRYEACASRQPIEPLNGGPIQALEALDAFGAAGSYDRPSLSRLYGGTRVEVARGWTLEGNRFTSITRLSPYPDASLTHLESGTLEIRFVAILSP
jgi:hypothetical protein